MQIQKNIVVIGSSGRPMPTDVFYSDDTDRKPVVIYAHGFNGFKDWGNFDIIAQQFAEAGFVFVKFNFSHNGTTTDAPEDFADLDAYAENNYTTELEDLGLIIDWVSAPAFPAATVADVSQIYLIGHSMGGGIVLLKASEDDRIKAVATWASIGECKTPWSKWPEEKLQQWKKEGVAYGANSRTKQEMPLNYQLYEDYNNNKDRLNIKKAVQKLGIRLLFCHGVKDEAVPVETANELHITNVTSRIFLVDSDHVFGRKHPWTESYLPSPMQEVVDTTKKFFSTVDH